MLVVVIELAILQCPHGLWLLAVVVMETIIEGPYSLH